MTAYVDAASIRQHIEQQFPASATDGAQPPSAPWLKPYVYRHPSEIPRREWLYGSHYLRDFTTATFAPGGVGKSVLCMTEAVAMALGRPLLGIEPTGRYRVAYWNGEDPLEEIERRLAAVQIEYGIEPGELGGFFFWGSGREHGLTIAEQTADGTRLCVPDVEKVKACVRDLGLDQLIIDPFVSSHRVQENDNNAIDTVAKAWGQIAGECNIGIELSHHTVKHSGRETRVEDGRGGGALLFAVRSARVLNVMTEEEAERAGVDRRRSYFRVDNGKANLAPPPDKSDWYRFVGVDLYNGPNGAPGDNVGVIKQWEWPAEDMSAGRSMPKLSGSAQAIWSAYGRLLDDGKGTVPPRVPGAPSAPVAVSDGQLRTMATQLRLVTEPHPPKEDDEAVRRWQGSARQAWARGTDQLVKAGMMRFEGGFAWALPKAASKADFARVTSRDEKED